MAERPLGPVSGSTGRRGKSSGLWHPIELQHRTENPTARDQLRELSWEQATELLYQLESERTELKKENERLRRLQQPQTPTQRQQTEFETNGALSEESELSLETMPLAAMSFEAIGIHENGVLRLANNQFFEMFGYAKEELLGKQVIPLTVAGESREILQRQIAADATEPYEAMGLRKDGTTFPIEVRARLIEIEGRRIRVGVIRDISDRKQAEETRHQLESQANHTQKLASLGRLAGGIAHDFNNLLMGILGNAELANLKLAPLSPVRSNIQEIEKAAKRAAELASQLLAYSGQCKHRLEPVDLSAMVSEVVKLLGASLPKRIELQCQLGQQLPPVEADVSQLRQVVVSLINNATEAIGDDSGKVSLTTRLRRCDRAFLRNTYVDDDLEEGYYLCLEVADSGCGMDSETLEQIFEPFFSTKYSGRGLGLAAPLGIIRAHHGAIKAESRSGIGTRILVLLPAATPVEVAGQAEETAADEPLFSGTVLLADDEAMVRMVAETMLRKLGFEVITAVDGREAVQLFRRHAERISLVLLDSKMPHLNGEDAFPEMRRIRSDVRVILSSGFSREQTLADLEGEGLAGFIHKPYSFNGLKQKIREVMQPDPVDLG